MANVLDLMWCTSTTRAFKRRTPYPLTPHIHHTVARTHTCRHTASSHDARGTATGMADTGTVTPRRPLAAHARPQTTTAPMAHGPQTTTTWVTPQSAAPRSARPLPKRPARVARRQRRHVPQPRPPPPSERLARVPPSERLCARAAVGAHSRVPPPPGLLRARRWSALASARRGSGSREGGAQSALRAAMARAMSLTMATYGPASRNGASLSATVACEQKRRAHVSEATRGAGLLDGSIAAGR